MDEELERRIEFVKNSPKLLGYYPEIAVEEKAAIYLYTDTVYVRLNQYLRKEIYLYGDELSNMETYSQLISFGLKKVRKPFNGVAHRGIALEKWELDQYREALQSKSSITYHSFSSASIDAVKARDFATMAAYQQNHIPVVLQIESLYGVDITSLSVTPEEKEILFDKDTTMKVTGVDFEDGRYYIDLEEVVV